MKSHACLMPGSAHPHWCRFRSYKRKTFRAARSTKPSDSGKLWKEAKSRRGKRRQLRVTFTSGGITFQNQLSSTTCLLFQNQLFSRGSAFEKNTEQCKLDLEFEKVALNVKCCDPGQVVHLGKHLFSSVSILITPKSSPSVRLSALLFSVHFSLDPDGVIPQWL